MLKRSSIKSIIYGRALSSIFEELIRSLCFSFCYQEKIYIYKKGKQQETAAKNYIVKSKCNRMHTSAIYGALEMRYGVGYMYSARRKL